MLKFVQDIIDKVKNAPTTTIVVNGKSFSGRNVTVINGNVIVDGKKMEIPDSKEVKIEIHGDVGILDVDIGEVQVTGSVGNVTTDQGAVTVSGDVKGYVRVDQGNVECHDIFSDVQIDMGNVKASTIHGSASTKMGNITK